MKEPEYIVYFIYRKGCYFLDVIHWPAKGIWEKSGFIKIRKKITKKLINNAVDYFIHPNNICWENPEGNAIYKLATLKNLKEILTELECNKISYMYYIY